MSPKTEKLFKEAMKTQIRKIRYEAKEEGIEEGYEKGLKQGIENTAKNLKEILSDEEIAKSTGLSLEKIKEL